MEWSVSILFGNHIVSKNGKKNNNKFIQRKYKYRNESENYFYVHNNNGQVMKKKLSLMLFIIFNLTDKQCWIQIVFSRINLRGPSGRGTLSSSGGGIAFLIIENTKSKIFRARHLILPRNGGNVPQAKIQHCSQGM